MNAERSTDRSAAKDRPKVSSQGRGPGKSARTTAVIDRWPAEISASEAVSDVGHTIGEVLRPPGPAALLSLDPRTPDETEGEVAVQFPVVLASISKATSLAVTSGPKACGLVRTEIEEKKPAAPPCRSA